MASRENVVFEEGGELSKGFLSTDFVSLFSISYSVKFL